MDAPDLPPGLAAALDDRLKGCGAVKVQCLLSDSDAVEIITKARLPGKLAVRGKSSEYGDFRHGEFEVRDGGQPAKIFHTVQAGDELYAVAGGGAEFFSKRVSRIIKGSHPRILAAAVSSETLLKALRSYEKGTGRQLALAGYVVKKAVGAKLKTERTWNPREEDAGTIEGVFEEARNGGGYVSSVRVLAGPESDPDLDLSVSRKGLVSVRAGTFGGVFAWLLRPMAREAMESRAMLSKLGRGENEDRAPRPLLVKFGASVFRDEQMMKKFLKIMKKYPNCSYSVMRGGDPHVHMLVLDWNDKSSFSIMTVSDDELLVIPQIKSSAAALMRFSEFLTSSFREGAIKRCEETAAGGARE